MLDPETRRTILARVEAALDCLETGEAPPEGIVPALLEADNVPVPVRSDFGAPWSRTWRTS